MLILNFVSFCGFYFLNSNFLIYLLPVLLFNYTCLLLFQVAGNESPSTLISFASRSFNAGQLTSKLHVIELGAVPGHLLFFGFSSHMHIICSVIVSWFHLFAFMLSQRKFLCLVILEACCYDFSYWLSVKSVVYWLCYCLSGKPSFTKKQADLFFPPDFADDFPVSMQVKHFFFIRISSAPDRFTES
jgi:hypothetical protein